jgi:hypothetical protein
VSERRIDEVLKKLSNSNPFFSELESRIKINSIWKEMVGSFLASKTYVSIEKNETLEIWTRDSVVLSEIRFEAPKFLELFREKGINLKRVKVKRLI